MESRPDASALLAYLGQYTHEQFEFVKKKVYPVAGHEDQEEE